MPTSSARLATSPGPVSWATARYVDYSRGTGNDLFRMNVLQHGPILGISARF